MIDSPSNPMVKALKALAEGKARRERGQFVVEGVRVIEDGLRAGSVPEVCLFSPEMISRTERGAQLLRALRKLPPWVMFEASERALSAASDTQHSQGIVAAFKLPKWDPPSDESGTFLALVCDDVRDPGNMGTLLRTAEAAGVNAVWTSLGSVDVFNPKVVRASMGAHFRLHIYPDNTWEQITRSLAYLGIEGAKLRCTEITATTPYDQVNWTESAALIISNEAHGMTPAAKEACSGGTSISIPMAAQTESLNAAIAGAVIMFEAARQRRQVAQHA